ncbi:MAG: zinc ABC transporter substrate-binding protein [Bacteroidaceae bacterium]
MYKQNHRNVNNKHFILLLLCGILMAACALKSNKNTQAQRTIVVSIEPMRFFVEQIAGDKFHVETLVPEGSSPETYEPTPRQLIDLSESKAYLRVGNLGFERTWLEKLKENAPHLQTFNASQGIQLLRNEHGHSDEDDTDPHTWTSAKNAKVIAQNIYHALCFVDSASTDYYTARLNSLLHRISKTDSTLHHLLSNLEARSFMIYHPSLSYFSRDYGLQQLCIEEGGKEPTPMQLRQLVRKCQSEKIAVIFVQREFTDSNAKLIASETGAKIIEINPLSYHWEQELIHIAKSLRNGK